MRLLVADLPARGMELAWSREQHPFRMRVTPSLARPRCLAPAGRLPPAKLDPRAFSFLTKGNCSQELLSCSVLLIPGITAVTSIVTICRKADPSGPCECRDLSALLSSSSPQVFIPFTTFQKQDRELEAHVLDKSQGVPKVHLKILLLTL